MTERYNSRRVGGIRPRATYSIVARDPVTGNLGAAVQSHWFSVGPVVPWLRAGVGAVVTQSFTNVSYGHRGLDLLAAGKEPAEAARLLTDSDDGRDLRQLGIVDSRGRAAAYTGSRCVPFAGHVSGDGFSVQANMMAPDRVCAAMTAAWQAVNRAEAWGSGAGGAPADSSECLSFPRRLLGVLAAAEGEEGDIRGRQSAAIRIVRGSSGTAPWEETVLDLRVEDHPDPLSELDRLLGISEAYDHMNAGDLAVERGDFTRAEREYGEARRLNPGNAEMVFWYAVALANAGRFEEAAPFFREAFTAGGNWRELLKRIVGNGLCGISEANIARLT